ncbi:hypothetical protein [Chitinimonas naiadis]
MAESYPAPDPDTEPPAVLGKMDALIARHRGSGIDPNVPVLTDLDPAEAFGEIPVLTNVEPMVGDDLMFTPEEIRAEAPPIVLAPPAPVWKPTSSAAAEAAGLPAAAAPAEPPELLDLAPEPVAPPPPKPAATLNPPPPVLDFPELLLPSSKPPVAKPAPISAPSPLAGGPLMPDLALNFDFALPDEPAAVAPKPAPVAPVVVAPVPAPVRAPVAPVAPAPAMPSTPVARAASAAPQPLVPSVAAAKTAAAPPVAAAPASQVLVSEDFPELSIEIGPVDAEQTLAAGPAIDPAALTAELMVSLRPEIEKLVRSELARQIAVLHVESLKRTLGALQPQLDKLISGKIEEVLKRH